MIGTFEHLVELYLKGGWRDVSGDVRYLNGQGIRIQTGTQDQASSITSSCVLTLADNTGDYSPRDPLGQWYGYLKRNSPIRVGTRIVRDLFTSRAASNGFGNATQAPGTFAYTTSGGAAGDYAVTLGVGTITLPDTTRRQARLSDVALAGVEQRVTFQAPFSNTTGGSWLVALCFRGAVAGTYRAQVTIAADESVTVQFLDYAGAGVGSPTTVAGLTHSGQKITIAAHMDGEVFRAKVWAAASLEPYTWTLEDKRYSTTTAGWTAVEAQKSAGNTNGTFAVSITDYQVIERFFAGEVSEWPPERDTSGNDTVVTITASNLLRRLRTGAGQKPVRSPAYRALSKALSTVAYWSCEDGSTATQFASYNEAQPDMMILSGSPSKAASSLFAASQPLPKVNNSVWEGQVTPYTAPSPALIQLRWLQLVDTASEPPTGATLLRIRNSGTATFWIVRYTTGGLLTLEVQNFVGGVLASTAMGLDVRNVGARMSLQLTQNGANVDWLLGYADVDLQSGFFVTGTLAGATIGVLQAVAVGSDANLGAATVIGQISAQTVISSFFDFTTEFYAWQGERAAARAYRILATEEGIPYHSDGDLTLGITMGVQPLAAPLDFLDQTVLCDQGVPFEPHFHASVGYMTNTFLTNRAARLTMDYSIGRVFGKLPVVEDDTYTVNDVTVQKGNSSNSTGSKVRLFQATGPLANTSPDQGGVGSYEKGPTINCNTIAEVTDLAGWILMKGTVDQPRAPEVTILMHNPRIYASIPTLMAAWDIREGSFVTVSNIPINLCATDLYQMVIGVKHRLTQFEHEITWNCAPGDPWRVLTLDDSYYRVEAGASFLNADITSGATSMSVKSLDGGLFSLDPADMPATIECGGEQMTVTAVAGATSPQTLTVTRSVNRVVKAHVADDTEQARVTVVTRAVLALS